VNLTAFRSGTRERNLSDGISEDLDVILLLVIIAYTLQLYWETDLKDLIDIQSLQRESEVDGGTWSRKG
jgi:hypothetical protein